MELPIDRIVIRDRSRTELRNIESLANSIRETGGPLHPPVVRLDGNEYVLVAGARRLAAMRQLGYDRITVTIAHSLVDELSALRAEGEENTEREPFLPTEAVAHAARIEAVVAARAKARQAEAGRSSAPGRKAETSADSSEVSPKVSGETRAEVAAAVGMSHPKLKQAREVVAAATDETLPDEVREVAKQAAAAMDRTGNVNGAHKMLTKAKEAAEPAAKALTALVDDALPDGWPLIDRAEKGITALIRGLLAVDAAELAAVASADLAAELADLRQSFDRWFTTFQKSIPAHGLRLVGGRK